MQLPEKMMFATSPIRNALVCFSKGLAKRAKTSSKPTCYASAFSRLKNCLPASILLQLGFLFASQDAPKGPPTSKTLLEASWAILAASSNFLPPRGTTRPYISRCFYKFLMFFKAAFVLKVVFCRTSCLCNYFGFSAPQRHNRVPLIALLSLRFHQLLANPPIAAAVWAKPL